MHNSITYVRPSEKSSHQGNLIRLARSDYDWGRRYNVGQKNGAGLQIRYKLSENIASEIDALKLGVLSWQKEKKQF